MTQVLGSILSLWRYPVKSMIGEELNTVDVGDRGLQGDRAYALIDSADGKVASAKNPRKWPQLFDCRAELADVPQAGVKTPVRITLPDGSVVNSEQPGISQVFSKVLKREVRLSALPDVQGILRTAAQHNKAHVGVYASVLQGGQICRGDAVRLE